MSQIYMKTLMKMLLTDKQVSERVKWFIETNKPYCTTEPDGRLSIPIIYSDNPRETELEHREMRRKRLKKIMWRNYNSWYVHKGWRETTLWEAQLEMLWLYNGPIFKSNKDKYKWNLTKLYFQIKETMKHMIARLKEMLGLTN